MNKPKTILIMFGILIGAIIISTALKNTSEGMIIEIEAEQASVLEYPFEIIEAPMASGGKAVTSTIRSDEYESSLLYKMNIEKSGRYRFLANCYWPGGCNNSFEFQFDNGNRYVFGNDKGKFDIWHIVSGPVIKLTRGSHELRIWNKESFSQIDKIILSNEL